MRKIIFSATLLLALSQLASRLLGLFRERTLAEIFGTGNPGIWNLDLYLAAFRLPDLIYNIVIFGALSAAFVPILATTKNQTKMNQTASSIFNFLFSGILGIAILLFFFAEPAISLLTPGFSAAEQHLTAQLLRLQLLAPIFFTFSGIFGGLAQHTHKFFWYALAPIFYNLGIILGLKFLSPTLGVWGASYGVVAGAAAHALIQLPGIFQMGFRFRLVYWTKQLQQFLQLAGPRIFAVAILQFIPLGLTVTASFIGAGALAIFNYAWNIASLPFGLIGLAFATTSFAELAKLAKFPKLKQKFQQKFQINFLAILFWILPASLGLYFLSPEIVRLILVTGNFDSTDAHLVSTSLKILSCAVPFISLWPFLNNVFFAQKNTRIPLLGALLACCIVFLTSFGTSKFGAASLALSFAAAYFSGVLFLFCTLPKFLRQIQSNELSSILELNLTFGCILFSLTNFWQVTDFWPSLWKASSITILGGLLYLGCANKLDLKFWHGHEQQITNDQ